jgi:glucose/arabinose dehydrogenase
MQNRFRLFASLLSISILHVTMAAESGKREVDKVYLEFCASCHGTRMDGGKGGSLIDGQWRHGGDDANLLRSIRDGYPASGMPGFGNVLDEAETRALITLIRETATRRVDPAKGEERSLPLTPLKSEEHGFKIEVIAEGFDVPWSMEFLPDGRILVAERVGQLRVIEDGRLAPDPIAGVPEVIVRDEAGLMCVVADPEFEKNNLIYLSFSDPGENEESAMTKIIRARLNDGRLEDPRTIFSLPREEYQKTFVLFGGRMTAFGPYLYFGVGERGLRPPELGQAQDLSRPVGKIHRVKLDGTIPDDNPYVEREGAWKSIWAYGMRNPQGLTIDRRNGDVWETEHGPRGGDELNRIEPGKNYGWPAITSGLNYDGTPISDKTAAPGMEQPVINWTPSIAVSQIEFYRGDKFPRWKNNLFIGSLAQQKLIRIVVEDGKEIHREQVFDELGRIRDIKTGPDGYLYLALEFVGKHGVIARLVPAD